MDYRPESVTRELVDTLPGGTVLQFGTNWCGYCQGADATIEQVLGERAELHRILVEDGKGRPLGRSYRVKLWPTLIFLADGVEVVRVVRPWGTGELRAAVADLDAALAAGRDRT
jgi:Thiol-disulfide isomerase and thioredoxins